MLADRLDPFRTKYPIWNAGMGGGLAGPEQVHGISKAGGFGVLGVGGLPANRISEMISETRDMTPKPFGTNVILPMSDGKDVDACFDNQVDVIILFCASTIRLRDAVQICHLKMRSKRIMLTNVMV